MSEGQTGGCLWTAMNLKLYAGPDPEANLDALLKRTPLRLGPVCAVVPDTRSAVDLETKLARFYGGGFTGHKVFTMDGLARAILSNAGIDIETVSVQVQRALAGEVAASRFGRNSPYAPISGYPGFTAALLAYLADVRSAEKFFFHSHELASAASAYDTHLKRLGAADHEGLVMMALENGHVEQFSSDFVGPLIVHGFYDFTGRQFQLLARLILCFSRCAVTIPHDPSRQELFSIPGRLCARFEEMGGEVVRTGSSSENGTGMALNGFRGGEYPGNCPPGEIQIHTFRSESSEAGWIAGFIRDRLASEIWKPDEIMIVSRSKPGYGSPIEIALRRNCIPVAGGIRRPLSTHPVVRVILDAIEYSIHPENDDLAEMVLSSNYTGGKKRKAGRTFISETDDRGWSCILADTDSPEGFVSSVKRMIEWLNIGKNLDGGGDYASALSEIGAFNRLNELLEEFALFYSPILKMVKVNELHRLFILFISDSFFTERPFVGKGVILADVNHARFTKRKIVFFTGLDNRPLTAGRNIFTLHDPNFAREVFRHAEEEDSLLFYLSVYGAEKLFLTFPGIDASGEDSSISPYLREIQKNVSWCRTTFHHGINGEGWEGGYCGKRGRGEYILRKMKRDCGEAVRILGDLLLNDKSEAARIERSLALWIGMQKNPGLNLASPVLLKETACEWGKDRVYSVSGLEDYASCPVRFFLSRVLGLKAKSELPDEVETSARGILIHEILARFYRTLLERTGNDLFQSGLCEKKRLMEETCEKLFAEHAQVFSGLHPVVILAEKKFIRSWMDYFLENETEYFTTDPFRPVCLETGFGIERFPDGTGFPPLKIENEKDSILVSGRIDRIDIDSNAIPPRIRIIDYKTGEYKASLKEIESGKELQAPLYLKAALEHILPESSIHESVFYSLRNMTFVRYKMGKDPVEGNEAWSEYIRNACGCSLSLADKIRSGKFPAGACKDNRWCDFRQLCRGGRKTSGEEGEDADS
jgi:hypothetical protein